MENNSRLIVSSVFCIRSPSANSKQFHAAHVYVSRFKHYRRLFPRWHNACYIIHHFIDCLEESTGATNGSCFYHTYSWLPSDVFPILLPKDLPCARFAFQTEEICRDDWLSLPILDVFWPRFLANLPCMIVGRYIFLSNGQYFFLYYL